MVPYYGPITTPPYENTLLSYARSHLWRSFRSDPTGLIWMGARYYSPRATRFLSPDPIGASNCLNLYHYAYGDPINYHDPDGRFGSAVYHSPAAQSPLVQAASLAMMHCTDPQFQSALHTSGHYLFHPRMMGALQMAGGFAEASIGTGLMGTPFAPLGAFLMLHGADHMATGFRSLTSGQHARTLTTSGLMQMGLSESSASMIDSGIGIIGSGAGVSMGLRMAEGSLQLGGYANANHAAYIARPVPSPRGLNKRQEIDILFGQGTVRASFGKKGTFQGQRLTKIVNDLKIGKLSPDQVPINIIYRDGQAIAINNRSLLVLKRSGYKPTVIKDVTGDSFFEGELNRHLRGSSPSHYIRVRGGEVQSSYVGP